MNRDQILECLRGTDISKAFKSDLDSETFAESLVMKAAEILESSEIETARAIPTEVRLVTSEPSDFSEEELEFLDEDDFRSVDVRLFISSGGQNYQLSGSYMMKGDELVGGFKRLFHMRPEVALPTWSWSDVADRTGVGFSPAFQSFAKIATRDEVPRAVPAVNTLKEVDPFLRPDCLPFLRMPSGDNLCARFDKKTGEIRDYLLVMHDELLAYPMGHDLSAVIKYQGRTIGEELSASWEALADQIAEDGAEPFDEFCAAVDLMYAWDHWKFKLDKGVSANSEELCREWLEKWQALDSAVLRKNSGCQTITAFAAARVGEKQRAIDAAAEALRLPAREGDPRRRALALLEELSAEVPEDLQTLCECVRSSEKPEEVQRALAAAAQKRTDASDRAGAYELLMRACFDCEAAETADLLQLLLAAARSAGYDPVTRVLEERLAKPSS